MEKKSNIKEIVDAFTKETEIDAAILQFRRDICEPCPYNSKNAEDKSVLSKIRDVLVSEPHCTACGCQIKEKTASETSECGLVDIGIAPKWNRVKLETKGTTDLDIVNLTPEVINLNLDEKGTSFEINYGNITMVSSTAVELAVYKKDGIEVKQLSVGCGCTGHKLENKEEYYNIQTSLDLTKVNKGMFKKSLTIYYTRHSKDYKVKVMLVGILKK